MPALSTEQLVSLAPGADPGIAAEHVARLDARYFDRFSPAEIARHATALSALGPGRPAVVLVEAAQGRRAPRAQPRARGLMPRRAPPAR